MSKYKHILFDWDGCLAKTLEAWLTAYKQTLAELNISKTDREITAVFGDWHGGTKLGAPDNDKFFSRIDELVKSKMPTIDLADNAKETLSKLKKENLKLAILTSSLKNYLLPPLKYHGILDHFDLIITGEDVTKHKPDPEVIKKAMNEIGGRKSDFIMIGDSDKDVQASKNAGIDSILYYPKEHNLFYDLETLMKEKPTFLAKSFDEISKILSVS